MIKSKVEILSFCEYEAQTNGTPGYPAIGAALGMLLRDDSGLIRGSSFISQEKYTFAFIAP